MDFSKQCYITACVAVSFQLASKLCIIIISIKYHSSVRSQFVSNTTHKELHVDNLVCKGCASMVTLSMHQF